MSIIVIVAFISSVAFAGPKMNESIRIVFEESKSTSHISEKISESARKISSLSGTLRDLTAPRNKEKHNIKLIQEKAKALDHELKELKRLANDLDSSISRIHHQSKKMHKGKCPPGFHWVEGYTTPEGRRINGHCRPN